MGERSSASLHILLGGARHKVGHDVTSNLHTLREQSRSTPLCAKRPPLRDAHEIHSEYGDSSSLIFLLSGEMYQHAKHNADCGEGSGGGKRMESAISRHQAFFTDRPRNSGGQTALLILTDCVWHVVGRQLIFKGNLSRIVDSYLTRRTICRFWR